MLSRRSFVAVAGAAILVDRVQAQTAPTSHAPTQFVRISHQGKPAIARIDGDKATLWSSTSLADALTGKGQATTTTIPLASADILPNVDANAKILCMALNYVNHAAEAKQPVPESPLLFFKSQEAMIAPTALIAPPAIYSKLDYEGELAIMIGKEALAVSVDKAWDHVAGVAAFNDTTARDLQDVKAGQRTHLDWFSAKSLDRSTPVGRFVPVAHIADDLKARRTRVMTRVNGEERQNAAIADMVFDIPQIVSFISTRVRLSPGDIIATGTPPGVGFGSGRFLKKGDVVEVEISGLPVLRSVIG